MPDTVGQYQKVRNVTDFKTFRFDVETATVWYMGFAGVGSLTSDPVWQVRKYLADPSGDVTVLWADGNTEFDNIWDNRASLNYL